MAAEFDSSGFSAVDKFFGNGAEKATGEKKLTGSSTAGSSGKRRGGVGANNKRNGPATNILSSDLLVKQVLNVGRKRARDNSNDDASEEYEGDGVDDHGVHDADEADGGRTSIVEKKAPTLKKSGGTDKILKANKKLGRKERERQKHGVNTANHDHTRRSDIAATETSIKGGGDDAVKHIKPTEHTVKQKRRKVRSRQKNIRKDNRSVGEKPAHLIPGNPNYQGRPMTQATRERLNLPPPLPRKNRNNFKNVEPLFTIDRNPDSSGDDVGVNLAIDELTTDFDAGDVDEKAARAKEKTKSSKKKKKRFKNLV